MLEANYTGNLCARKCCGEVVQALCCGKVLLLVAKECWASLSLANQVLAMGGVPSLQAMSKRHNLESKNKNKAAKNHQKTIQKTKSTRASFTRLLSLRVLPRVPPKGAQGKRHRQFFQWH